MQLNFFENANKGINHFAYYVIGVILTLIGYFIGQTPLLLVSMYAIDKYDLGTEALQEFEKTVNFELLNIDKNLGFLILISMFIFGTLGLWVALKVQRKSFLHIITPKSTIDLGRVFFGFIFWLGLGILGELISYGMQPNDYIFQFTGSSFFILVLIAIFLLPIQTSFEEFFFRGYIMQGLSNLMKNKLLVILITSILFAALHGTNPEVKEYGMGIMMTYYIIAGAFLAVIVVMDGRLELALGVHAATNFFGSVLVSYEGSVLQTDSLFKTSKISPALMTISFTLTALIFLYFCSKRYHWGPFSSLLTPITFSASEELTQA
jgi:hypothetical protein